MPTYVDQMRSKALLLHLICARPSDEDDDIEKLNIEDYIEEGKTEEVNTEEVNTKEANTERNQYSARRGLHDENPVARRCFTATFPQGYTLVSTSGEGLLCGLRALATSIEHQLELPPPDSDELYRIILKSESIQTFEKATGEQARANKNNFYIDQLAAVLTIWGGQQSLDLQLGYVLSDETVFLVPTPTTSNTKIVWIHSTSSTGSDDQTMQHYEGIKKGCAATGGT